MENFYENSMKTNNKPSTFIVERARKKIDESKHVNMAYNAVYRTRNLYPGWALLKGKGGQFPILRCLCLPSATIVSTK